jgi:hypothetical protein
VDWVIAYDVDGEPIYPNPDHPEFFLRLKGSGMWLPSEPFEFPGITLKPLPSMRHPGVDTIEIRGTAFPKTATSDIVNNPIINNMMKKLGLRSCNVPLGLWYYGNMDNDPAPNIPKACNVMKTLSDRRCESNLFAGLEEIVLSGIGSDEAESVMHQISKVYERFKIEPPGDANRTYVRADGLWKYGVNIMIESVMGTTLAGSIKDLTDWDVVRGGLAPSEDVYKAIAPTFRLPGDRPLIKIAKLFGRVGWEAGRCTAAVHRCGFDWGTYQDHLPDGMLDNAHANNLVVLPGELMDLGNERYQLLYPTDFDMSFKKEQAVNVDDRPPHPDPKFVEIIFQVEMGNMLMNIAGYTAALKGVVTGDWQRDPEPSPQMDLIWALRDIAVWEYFQGYKRPADPKYHGNDLILQDALLFVGEALERTIDVVV